MEGFVSVQITRSRRGKLYIDDSHWGPEADSLKFGYRVPIGSIQIFIQKTKRSKHKPNTGVHAHTHISNPKPDLVVHVETSSQQQADFNHTFVGFVIESPEPAHSVKSLTN